MDINLQTEIYNELKPLLVKYISINFPDMYQNHEDIIHDVFIKIITKSNFNRLKGEKSTYWCNICRNHIMDIIRSNKSSKERESKYIYFTSTLLYEIDEEQPIDIIDNVNSMLYEVFSDFERIIINERYINKKYKTVIRKEFGISDVKLKKMLSVIDEKIKQYSIKDDEILAYISQYTKYKNKV